MTDQPEELTPILVPFEKALRSQRGAGRPINEKKYQYDQTKDAVTKDSSLIAQPSATPVEKTYEHSADPIDAKPTGKIKTAMSNASNKIKQGVEQGFGGDWTDSGRNNATIAGASVATNAVATGANWLNKMGKASKKMVDGILNPGMMGQNAAGATLDAAERVAMPNEQDQKVRAGLYDAANTAQEIDQNNQAREAQAGADAQAETMRQDINQLYRDSMTAAGLDGKGIYDEEYTPTNYKKFATDLAPKLEQKVREWKMAGMDPDTIQKYIGEMTKAVDFAKERYGYSAITEKEQKKAKRIAKENYQDAKEKNLIAQTAYDTAKGNEQFLDDMIQKDPNLGRLQAIYEEMDPRGGEGQLDAKGRNPLRTFHDLFIDKNGNNYAAAPFTADSGVRLNLDSDELKKLNETLIKRMNNTSLSDADRKYADYMHTWLSGQMNSQDLRRQDAKDAGKLAGRNQYLSDTAYSIPDGIVDPALNQYLSNTNKDVIGGAMSILRDNGAFESLSDEEYREFVQNGILSHDPSSIPVLNKVWTSMMKRSIPSKADEVRKKLETNQPITEEEERTVQEYALLRSIAARKVGLDLIQHLSDPSSTFAEKFDENGKPVFTADNFPGYSMVQDLFGDIRSLTVDLVEEGMRKADKELIESQALFGKDGVMIGKTDKMGLGDVFDTFSSASLQAGKGQGVLPGYDGTASDIILSPEMAAAQKIVDAVNNGDLNIVNTLYNNISTYTTGNTFAGLRSNATSLGLAGFENFYNTYGVGQYSPLSPKSKVSRDSLNEIQKQMKEIDDKIKDPNISDDTRMALNRFRYGFALNYSQAIKSKLGDMLKNKRSNRSYRNLMGDITTEWMRFRNSNLRNGDTALDPNTARSEVDALLNGTLLPTMGTGLTSSLADTKGVETYLGRISKAPSTRLCRGAQRITVTSEAPAAAMFAKILLDATANSKAIRT